MERSGESTTRQTANKKQKQTMMQMLVKLDRFIKMYSSIFIILIFLIALLALVFSLLPRSESVSIEQGFLETCQAEYDQDSLDKVCVKKILKLREVREAPDVSEHLDNIEKELTTQVKSNTQNFVKQEVTEGVTEVKNKNKQNFDSWKDQMDTTVNGDWYLNKIATKVPKPEKQFNGDEELKLRDWVQSVDKYADLLTKSEEPLSAFNKLHINENVLREVKQIADDSKTFGSHNSMSGLRYKIESLENEDGPFLKPLKTYKNEQEELKGNVNSLLTKYYDIRATQDVGGGKEPVYMVLIGIGIISVTSLILSLYNKGSKPEPRQFQSTSYEPDFSPERSRQPHRSVPSTSYTRPRSILNGVDRKRCDNMICLVSFYRETQGSHRRILNSILNGTRFENLRVEQVIINKHEQIKDIPGAKAYLIFIDYNQRHVILENPDLGLGDLRLTTVRGCKKIGGQVAVLYVGDDGSRRLGPGQLFNSSLTSVHQHEDLRVLNDQQRFFSTHTTLTQEQTEHLQEFIMNTVDSF